MVRSLPFCRISKCSHKISPVKGGAIAKKPSRPSPTISRPCIFIKASTLLISSENSRLAQLSQMRTCSAVHWRGSAGEKIHININCTANHKFIFCPKNLSFDRHTTHLKSFSTYFFVSMTLKWKKICKQQKGLINMRDQNKFPSRASTQMCSAKG